MDGVRYHHVRSQVVLENFCTFVSKFLFLTVQLNKILNERKKVKKKHTHKKENKRRRKMETHFKIAGDNKSSTVVEIYQHLQL